MSELRWPPEPEVSELYALRRDRIAILMALKDKNFEYVDNQLAKDHSHRSLFGLQTIAGVVWPVREHLKHGTLVRDLLHKKLVEDGYDQSVIERYMGEMF